MCLAVAAAGAFNTMSSTVAMAQEGAEGAAVMRPLFNGKYEMPGMKYNKYESVDQITDLASNSKFSPGLSGASHWLLRNLAWAPQEPKKTNKLNEFCTREGSGGQEPPRDHARGVRGGRSASPKRSKKPKI